MQNVDTTPEIAFLLEDQAKKIAELTKDLEEYQRIFNMNYEADMRAIKLWQRRTGTTRTWPDRADMVLFLITELEKRTAEESSVVRKKKQPANPDEAIAILRGALVKIYDRTFTFDAMLDDAPEIIVWAHEVAKNALREAPKKK